MQVVFILVSLMTQQELIQNADDAEATVVKFSLDTREHPKENLMCPRLNLFQGPALLAYNDATFKNEDWKHFGKIENSKKETEVLKVGRFGVGFLSVFHVTGMSSIKQNIECCSQQLIF